jgi:CBS domain containing-hemolysin-like protein
MEWIADPTIWVGLVTLVFLEIVLGIDNLIFIAILSDKLPPGQRDRARILGLSLALIMRLALLASISWVMSLSAPLFSLWRFEPSWRDLILIAGGLFLLIKATTEIHDRLEAQSGQALPAAHASFWPIVAQIVVLDAVFSLDSVITAVGMVDELYVMMAAVVIAVIAMLFASKPLTLFVNAHPSLVILCLGFLLMIGLVLVVDGFGIHVPKGYVYAAIGFSVLIEILNQFGERKRRARTAGMTPRQRLADAVLRLLGGVPSQVPALAGAQGMSMEDEAFAPEEKRMLRGVLGLAQRPVTAIMTPRRDVAWLNTGLDRDALLRVVRESPYREFPAGRGSGDDIEGVVRKEDILHACLGGEPLQIEKIMRSPVAVPESASVLDALKTFKHSPVELALVVDEYGGFRGVVTRTDLLEAIAGNLPDAHGDPAEVQPLADGALFIDAAMPIEALQERLGLQRLPQGEFNTAAGFALALFGRIPGKGEKLAWDGWTFEVAALEGNRILRLLARPS